MRRSLEAYRHAPLAIPNSKGTRARNVEPIWSKDVSPLTRCQARRDSLDTDISALTTAYTFFFHRILSSRVGLLILDKGDVRRDAVRPTSPHVDPGKLTTSIVPSRHTAQLRRVSMSTNLSPPRSSDLPGHVDVVVIGGGIIGASTAFHLASKGVSVTLLEKGELGKEQSGRNQGWCRMQKREEVELPMILDALAQWDTLKSKAGIDTGFTRCGTLTLYPSSADADQAEKWLSMVAPYDGSARLLTGQALEKLIPGARRKWTAGLYAPRDGRAEPTVATTAIAAGAVRYGAKIFTQCAARGIQMQAGRVSGVVTEKGEIRCQTVVLAGGVWSTLFCRSLGIRLPQLQTKSSLLRTGPIPGAPDVSTKGPNFVFRKRADGGYTVGYGAWNRSEIVPDSFRYLADFLPMLLAGGNNVKLRVGRLSLLELFRQTKWSLDSISPFEAQRTLDVRPNASDIQSAIRSLQSEFPQFNAMTVKETWAGLIDVMADTKPVISTVDEIPGLVISTGYSGHGFGVGPAAGLLTAELVMGTATPRALAPFRLFAFRDLSPNDSRRRLSQSPHRISKLTRKRYESQDQHRRSCFLPPRLCNVRLVCARVCRCGPKHAGYCKAARIRFVRRNTGQSGFQSTRPIRCLAGYRHRNLPRLRRGRFGRQKQDQSGSA